MPDDAIKYDVTISGFRTYDWKWRVDRFASNGARIHVASGVMHQGTKEQALQTAIATLRHQAIFEHHEVVVGPDGETSTTPY